MQDDITHDSTLTTGRVLVRNTVWNLAGQAVPLVAGVFALPAIVDGLGTERFGVLTFAWLVIGYSGLFDLGLGRALTKLVAEKIGLARFEEIPALVWTALTLLLLLGIAGALIGIMMTPLLVHDVLKIPSELRNESARAFYLLMISIPIVISTVALRGVLEAHQRFDLVNGVRIPVGALSFVGPLLVLPFSESVAWVVAVLVGVRVVALMIYMLMCLHVAPPLRHAIAFKRSVIRPLVAFGSWMTVSNVVTPVIAYLDRFLIGASVGMVAVAYYTMPHEITTKLWIIPVGIVGVLFPTFSSDFANNPQRTTRLFWRGVKYIFIALFPFRRDSALLAGPRFRREQQRCDAARRCRCSSKRARAGAISADPRHRPPRHKSQDPLARTASISSLSAASNSAPRD